MDRNGTGIGAAMTGINNNGGNFIDRKGLLLIERSKECSCLDPHLIGSRQRHIGRNRVIEVGTIGGCIAEAGTI